jgi:hypothetical protein
MSLIKRREPPEPRYFSAVGIRPTKLKIGSVLRIMRVPKAAITRPVKKRRIIVLILFSFSVPCAPLCQNPPIPAPPAQATGTVNPPTVTVSPLLATANLHLVPANHTATSLPMAPAAHPMATASLHSVVRAVLHTVTASLHSAATALHTVIVSLLMVLAALRMATASLHTVVIALHTVIVSQPMAHALNVHPTVIASLLTEVTVHPTATSFIW